MNNNRVIPVSIVVVLVIVLSVLGYVRSCVTTTPPTMTVTPTEIAATVSPINTPTPTEIVVTATATATEIPPTPTEIAVTATATATEIPPTVSPITPPTSEARGILLPQAGADLEKKRNR